MTSKAGTGFRCSRAEDKGTPDSALGTGVWKGWWLCRRGEAPALGKAVPEIIPSLDLPATPSLARM